MFLRRSCRTVGGKKLTYFALVETVRTEAGPRQQVVVHRGELHADQQRRWQRTITFHNRQREARHLRLLPDDDHVPLPDDPDVVRIRLGSVGWTNPRRFGDVWLAWGWWRFLGLDELVARQVPHGDHTVRPADVVAIEVIHRLCGPCRELALAEHWYASTGLEDLRGIPRARRSSASRLPNARGCGCPGAGTRTNSVRPWRGTAPTCCAAIKRAGQRQHSGKRTCR